MSRSNPVCANVAGFRFERDNRVRRKVLRHKFGKTWYDIDIYEPHVGSCDPPEGRRPTITLPNGLKDDEKTLELLIHESLHASDFEMKEEKVEQTAKDIALFLRRVGYRLT